MKLFAVAAAIASLTLSLSSVAADGATAGKDGKTWGYKNNDPKMYGPSEWGAHYQNCAGKRQSPIDITLKSTCGDAGAESSKPLEFTGGCPDYKLKRNDDAYKGEVQNGTCSVRAKGKSYSMLQFHMHAPSEHTVDGKAYDAEVHFVHKNTDGTALLVVGVFVQKTQDAKADPWLTSVWNALGAVSSNNASEPIKLGSYASLLATTASKGRVFNYPGSLTTPTCDEIVDWWVLQTPLQVSAEDFDKFQAQLKKLPATDGGNGARPVQPLNGRTVAVY